MLLLITLRYKPHYTDLRSDGVHIRHPVICRAWQIALPALRPVKFGSMSGHRLKTKICHNVAPVNQRNAQADGLRGSEKSGMKYPDFKIHPV